MDVVSSYRTKGFCDHLYSFGVYPTIVTHRWEKDSDGNWKFHKADEQEVIEANAGCSTIRLPRRKSVIGRNFAIQTVANYLRGIIEQELVESYNIFREFLLKHLISHKYDVIMTIYSPHFQMKLAHEMKYKFGIPYITDFRDLWDNQIVTKSYNPSFKKKVVDIIIGYWWKKWITHASFFTTTGEFWKTWLEAMTGTKGGVVVRNGLEEEMKAIVRTSAPTDEFIIVHFGSLYSNQVLNVFLEGFKSFIQSRVGPKIKLVIIGHKPTYGIIIERLLMVLPTDAWELHPYMSKEELFNYCSNRASVFWMPGFIEDNGQFPVKVYDYLLLAKNILFVPKNDSDVQHVIELTNAGVSCTTSDEVRNQLIAWYELFKVKGFLPYFGNEVKITGYSREKQVKVMAEKIHECIR